MSRVRACNILKELQRKFCEEPSMSFLTAAPLKVILRLNKENHIVRNLFILTEDVALAARHFVHQNENVVIKRDFAPSCK